MNKYLRFYQLEHKNLAHGLIRSPDYQAHPFLSSIFHLKIKEQH